MVNYIYYRERTKHHPMLKKTFYSACALFTVMVTVYSLIILLLYSADPERSMALSALRIFLFFPFALSLCAANRIFDLKKTDSWLKTALHFISYMLATYLFLVLPLGTNLSPTAVLVGMFFFMIIYAAVFTAIALTRAKRARAENAEKEYTPVYRKH